MPVFTGAQVLSPIESLRELASGDKSIACFGDGELKLILDPLFNLGFQHQTPELRDELEAILSSPADGLMITLPQFARGHVGQKFWSEFGLPLKPLLIENYTYANTHVSRSLLFQQHGEEAVHLWNSIWNGKKVVVITGKGSRFDLVPELFGTAKAIERVDSLPRNAYSDVPNILKNETVLKAELVILSLGPSGTVLSSRLHQLGILSLDIGHLTSSYTHIMAGGNSPEQTPFVK
ncbi:GT-D fold domain-containing glycosyltransferase [Rothia nasimurium]|uniref:GT-D fold domain-containing glycosyltransferase n=1 Tax=Rothia nasimurium TaxID=85336 RepID=UPI0030147C0D